MFNHGVSYSAWEINQMIDYYDNMRVILDPEGLRFPPMTNMNPDSIVQCYRRIKSASNEHPNTYTQITHGTQLNTMNRFNDLHVVVDLAVDMWNRIQKNN